MEEKQINLEKIIGIPNINNITLDANLTGSINDAELYFTDAPIQKSKYVHFTIDKINQKTVKSMISACTLKMNVEAYGVYTKQNNTILINKITVKYN